VFGKLYSAHEEFGLVNCEQDQLYLGHSERQEIHQSLKRPLVLERNLGLTWGISHWLEPGNPAGLVPRAPRAHTYKNPNPKKAKGAGVPKPLAKPKRGNNPGLKAPNKNGETPGKTPGGALEVRSKCIVGGGNPGGMNA